MPLTLRHSSRVVLPLAMVVLLASVVLLAVASHSSGTRSVLAQLERPAQPAASAVGGAAPFTATAPARFPYAARLVITPNRANATGALTVTLAAHGRPVTRAAVTVTYSMPQMHMADVFTLALRPAGNGRYTTAIPIIGMAGGWRIGARVSGRGLRTASFAVDDHIVG